MSKHSPGQLKQMALTVLVAGEQGDSRYMEFMFTLAACCFNGSYAHAEHYTRSLANA